jgi:trigger factor
LNVKNYEQKDKKTAELTVEVTAEEFDKALEQAFKKNKNQISVPGFRKGKAPRKIIEKMYGASVFYNDALDIILPTVCSHGVSEKELRTVGYPKIQNVDFGDDKSAVVTYTVELYPEVKLGQYKGISAVKPAVSVDDNAVASEIAGIQLRNARIQTAERPAINGDTAVIDFEGFVDGVPFEGGKGEDYELVLGSNTFIPGFEEKLQGMKTGEERDLDLVFPKEYKEDLAGKPVIFKVKLKEVKEKILPELDDEFAKDVSEFDTLEEYKNSIREKLLAGKKEESDKAFEDAVLTKVVEGMECEVPDAMIEDYLDGYIENFSRQLASYGMELGQYLSMLGTNIEAFRDNIRPNSEKQIKATLALEKIAELEKLQPAEEEIEANYKEMSEKYGVEIDVAKQSVPKDSIVRELNLRAASKLLVENAIAEEPSEETAEAAAETAPEEAPAKEKKTSAKKAKADDTAATKTEEAETAEKKPAAKKTTAKKAKESEKTEG